MENFQKLKLFWKNKKVFITGHTGFKGSWLSIFLNMLGSKVYGYSLRPKQNSLFIKANLKKIFVRSVYGDINNLKKLKAETTKSKPEIVFHLAAQPLVKDSYEDPSKTFKTNVLGSLNILEAINCNDTVNSALLITTDKVYKDQGNKVYKEIDELGANDPYSTSKACMELLTASYIKSFFVNKKLYGKVATARSGNVVGGGDVAKNRLLPDIIDSINKEHELIIRNPSFIRPWQHVIEPLYGYIKLAQLQYTKKFIKNNSWNFGPNKESFLRVFDVVKKIRKFKNFNYRVNNKNKFKETKILKLDNRKSKKILKWFPKLNINQTIDLVISWNDLYNKNYNAKQNCEKQIMEYLRK